ncbi:sugar transferase [Rubellimicrobium aerolatum]|uniref:Sugar transferase n=1 Tax=Rubellimicrobium aerolatum TaxID=490979 RepID=A0ABW0S986_9RHOB|nr:sugar transferase [Rubellimicrobium aerolatum]MBP1804836.1 lipopolysaccharide/colanic/teichoic acid biosynthesis glycosyltransferase [Rubellimicrobium aerolatum]
MTSHVFAVGTGGASAMVYRATKRLIDVAISLLLLPPLAGVALVALALNPLFNRGSLFFVQERMGLNGQGFRVYKFRTMGPATTIARGPFDAIDSDRITPLGRILRESRLDELPQIVNVLKGEMTLVGPRPDNIEHARVYAEKVPGYRERHAVRPGISGYAQTEIGYVDSLDGVQAKVEADLHYLRHASLRFDLWIVWRTIGIMLGRKGS